jgi:mannose-6-phosphate isomerase-like protein (cupin superfamily)
MRLLVIALSVCAATTGLARAADTAKPGALAYWHLYSDSKGESHFEKKELSFDAIAPGGPLSALSTHQFANSQNVMLLQIGVGGKEDWHKAPRRQFMLIVQGEARVTASDGTVKEFTPGDVILMDDTTGKGHTTEAIGTQSHIAAVIPVPSSPVVPVSQ